jgi:hypothetical protein
MLSTPGLKPSYSTFVPSEKIHLLFNWVRQFRWDYVSKMLQENPGLEHKLDPTKDSCERWTLTDHAFYQRRLDVISSLRNQWHLYQAPLYDVISSAFVQDPQFIKDALDKHVLHVNTQYQVGQDILTLVDIAKAMGNTALVKELKEGYGGLSRHELEAFAAARRRDWKTVNRLLEQGKVEIDAKEIWQGKPQTLLDLAATLGDNEGVLRLNAYLIWRADLPHRESRVVITDQKMTRKMFAAAKANDFDKVFDCLKQGVHEDSLDPNEGQTKGWNLLEHAYHHQNQMAFLRLLVKCKVDIKMLQSSNPQKFEDLMEFYRSSSYHLQQVMNTMLLEDSMKYEQPSEKKQIREEEQRRKALGAIGSERDKTHCLYTPAFSDLMGRLSGLSLLTRDFPDAQQLVNFAELSLQETASVQNLPLSQRLASSC